MISDDEEDPPVCKMSDKREASPEDGSGSSCYRPGGKRPATPEDCGRSLSKRLKVRVWDSN